MNPALREREHISKFPALGTSISHLRSIERQGISEGFSQASGTLFLIPSSLDSPRQELRRPRTGLPESQSEIASSHKAPSSSKLGKLGDQRAAAHCRGRNLPNFWSQGFQTVAPLRKLAPDRGERRVPQRIHHDEFLVLSRSSHGLLEVGNDSRIEKNPSVLRTNLVRRAYEAHAHGVGYWSSWFFPAYSLPWLQAYTTTHWEGSWTWWQNLLVGRTAFRDSFPPTV